MGLKCVFNKTKLSIHKEEPLNVHVLWLTTPSSDFSKEIRTDSNDLLNKYSSHTDRKHVLYIQYIPLGILTSYIFI